VHLIQHEKRSSLQCRLVYTALYWPVTISLAESHYDRHTSFYEHQRKLTSLIVVLELLKQGNENNNILEAAGFRAILRVHSSSPTSSGTSLGWNRASHIIARHHCRQQTHTTILLIHICIYCYCNKMNFGIFDLSLLFDVTTIRVHFEPPPFDSSLLCIHIFKLHLLLWTFFLHKYLPMANRSFAPYASSY